MRRHDQLDITPNTIDLTGRGLQVVDDIEVATPNLFVGEIGSVRIDHRSKGGPKAFAILQTLTQPSEFRRPVPCKQHPSHPDGKGRCSGCALMPLQVPGQHEQKVAMLRSMGLAVDTIVKTDSEFGYRYSSKRVAYGGRHLRFGSYIRGTNDVADMTGCMVDHPCIVEAIEEIILRARELGLGAYGKHFAEGIRYALFKTDGKDVTVNFAVGDISDSLVRLAKGLRIPKGVTFSRVQKGNSVRAGEATLICGSDDLTLSFGDVDVTATTMGFTQPNPKLANTMYASLIRNADNALLSGTHALDLYAGSGLITEQLRKSFSRVDPCESHPESAKALGVAAQTAEFFLDSAKQAELQPELIVANPPRKGLGDAVCAALLSLSPARIHVMSCGPKGLKRDLQQLEEVYTVEALLAYDTLPQTPHVEVIAKLIRKA